MVFVNFQWDEKTVEIASGLWKLGHSAGQIAQRVGCKRNAVCGFAHRHRDLFPPRKAGEARLRTTVKLKPERPAKITRVRVETPKPVALPASWTRVPGEAARYDLSQFRRPEIETVAFVALGRNQCRFLLDTFDAKAGPQTPCCGGETETGASYCAHHIRLMRRAV